MITLHPTTSPMHSSKMPAAPWPRRVLLLALLVLLAGGCAANAGAERQPRLPRATIVPGGPPPDFSGVTDEVNIDIEVRVDSEGRPDMSTLRVTGPGAIHTQAAIARWIQSARFKPAEQDGRPVPGVFRTQIRTRIETRRVS
jgi:hypothetical protein